ncbi:hypothetical protein Vretifemale_4106, partial [Volvox reticuliferus]
LLLLQQPRPRIPHRPHQHLPPSAASAPLPELPPVPVFLPQQQRCPQQHLDPPTRQARHHQRVTLEDSSRLIHLTALPLEHRAAEAATIHPLGSAAVPSLYRGVAAAAAAAAVVVEMPITTPRGHWRAVASVVHQTFHHPSCWRWE